MRFLLDGTNFPGSDANTSLPEYGGDVFGKGIDPEVPTDNVPSSPDAAGSKDKARLIEEAKKIMRRGIDRAPGRLAARVGAPKNVVNALGDNSPEARQEVKDFAKQKTREFAKDKIGSQLKGGVKKGFEKGIKEGAGKAIKEGGKKAAKSAGKAVAKGVAKGAAQVGAKVGAKAGTVAAVEGGIAAAGAVTGAASFGLGFIISLFLDIAISLGINDAVDAVFELKEGNVKQAMFLALRAVAKVEVFIWFLVTVILMFGVVTIFIAIPSLIVLNIYMILGSIPAFKNIPHFQGMVFWEKLILVVIDVIAFLILIAFIGGIVYYLCETTGLGGGGVSGAATGVIVSVYDWWYGGSGAAFAQDLCTQVTGAVK